VIGHQFRSNPAGSRNVAAIAVRENVFFKRALSAVVVVIAM